MTSQNTFSEWPFTVSVNEEIIGNNTEEDPNLGSSIEMFENLIACWILNQDAEEVSKAFRTWNKDAQKLVDTVITEVSKLTMAYWVEECMAWLI